MSREASLSLVGGDLVVLSLVVEGQRADGSTVHCSEERRFLPEGATAPVEDVLDPEGAGLDDAPVHWLWLRAQDDLSGWTRTKIQEGKGSWTLPVLELPAPQRWTRLAPYGTARFAAGLTLNTPEGGRVLSSAGWTTDPDEADPERAGGFLLKRVPGRRLAHRAIGLGGIPVTPEATAAHARRGIALLPNDVFLAAYEDMVGEPVPGPRAEPLTGKAWTWLLEMRHESLMRRGKDGGALVSPAGRAVPWDRGSEGVQGGDVLVLDDGVAIAHSDDGDGWLGEGDTVVHAGTGQVSAGTLGDLDGGTVAVLRARDFAPQRAELAACGYGPLGGASNWGTDLRRAWQAFQSDRNLEPTGIPDHATHALLQDVVERMRSTP